MSVVWLSAPVDITPGNEDSWTDIDVSAHVSASAVAAVIRVTNASSFALVYGLRKNGSTDNLQDRMEDASQQWEIVGLDASGLLEGEIANSSIKFELTGYIEAGVVCFTNAVDKGRPSSNDSWQDCDISSDTNGDTAVAAFGLTIFPGTQGQLAQRKNGSTDSWDSTGNRRNFWAVGVDPSGIFEFVTNNVDLGTWYLTGYFTAAVVFHTNGINANPSVDATWEDHPLGSSSAVGGFIVCDGSAGRDYGARKNGTSLAWNADFNEAWGFAFVEADASGIIETYREASGTLYEIGYAEAATEIDAAPIGVGGTAIAGSPDVRADADIVLTGLAAAGAAGAPAAYTGEPVATILGGTIATGRVGEPAVEVVQSAVIALSGRTAVAMAGSIVAGNPWSPAPASTAEWSNVPSRPDAWSKMTSGTGTWN